MIYLSRKKVYEKQDPAKEAKKVYIFCEGSEREIEYFNYFKGLSTNINIIPIPPVNGKSDPAMLKNNAELLFFGDADDNILPTYKLSKDYKDEVWFVIDTDLWVEHGKIDRLENFCSEMNVDYKCWEIAQSNPCFELWLIYHIEAQKPTIEDVSKYTSFKEYAASKVPGGLDVRKIPVHLLDANSNSLANLLIEQGRPALYSTHMHILGQIIHSFVGEQLEKAKKMMHSASKLPAT
jgi:hypothetical protein